jgi:hypothetical protein
MTAHVPDTAIGRLHRLLVDRHWRGDGLVGPDCGIRLNYRVGRFVKSYLPTVPWRDDLYYLQAQAYWTLANWRLYDLTGHDHARALATACARGMLIRQRADGGWDYPNPEWRGRVATAEGSWAAIGLAETYRRTADHRFVEGALRWHRFLDEDIGYVAAHGGLAVNYFAGRAGPPVPNNSAFVLRLLAELSHALADERFLAPAPAVISFLGAAQRPSGELPYQLGMDGGPVRPHFQCPQYNAFQCLDLTRYRVLTGDDAVTPIIGRLLDFLHGAVEADGSVPYACNQRHPRVTYHRAAVAAALKAGSRAGEDRYADAADRVIRALLPLQRHDGGFPHSLHDYGVLSDRRTYPRSLAMILDHLLVFDHRPRPTLGAVLH